MPTFRMRTLGAQGVVKDLPPFELPPNTWSDAMNVRFNGGRVSKFGGNVIVLDDESMAGNIPLGVTQRSNKDTLIYGTNTGLWSVDGGYHQNISALVDNPTDPDDPEQVKYEASPDTTWYYTTLSNSMVFGNELNNPQGLRPNDVYFSELPGWGRPKKPTDYDDKGEPIYNYPKRNWKSPRIRAFRNYLLAMGMIEGSTEYPQRVRWSDVSYVNDLPANWYEDDPNKDGGFNDLTNSVGKIIDGCPLRDSFIIYTDRDTFIMDYIGGDLIFNFRKLFSDSGILAAECVCEFEGQHFVVSDSDIFVHNGSTRKSVSTGRIKEFLINEISSVNAMATKVFSLEARKEIWITYVSPGSTRVVNPSTGKPVANWACDKAAVWSWEFDTWTFYELPNSYDVCMGLPQTLDVRRWDKYEGEETHIDAEGNIVDSTIPPGCKDLWDDPSHGDEVWEEFGKTFKKQLLYCASGYGKFYVLDEGHSFHYYDDERNLITRPMVSYVERRSLDMDEQEENINQHKFITSVRPQFTGTGRVRVYTGGANDPESSPTWDGSQAFDIGEDVKVDCFTNYRYPAIRIIDPNEGRWNLASMDLKYFVEGTR